MTSEIQNNALPPARPLVLSMAGLEKEASEYTFREAVEWYKNVLRKTQELQVGQLRGAEVKAIDTTWAHLSSEIGKREGIPPGFIGYMLGELAQSELKLAEVAEQEFNEALS